jgi:hypothetical protein
MHLGKCIVRRPFWSPNWAFQKFYLPPFSIICVLRTMTAHTLPKYFHSIGGMVVMRTFSDGRTDGRTIGRWPWGHPKLGRTVASFLKLPGGKTPASARTRTGNVQAMDAKGIYKGSSNIPFSLPSLPWPREATVCLVHFVVWAAIRGSFLGHTCHCSIDQVFFY